MTLKLKVFALAAASLLPFAGHAAAPQKPFKDVDANHDGKLTRQEVQGTRAAKDFDKLDENHDGTLSIWEYAAEKPAAPAGSTRSEGYGNKWGSGQMGNGDQLQK